MTEYIPFVFMTPEGEPAVDEEGNLLITLQEAPPEPEPEPLPEVPSLLPANATPAERALEQATARVGAVPTPLRALWNPDTCPAQLLPWLAWALGVDDWEPGWPEEVQRSVIRASIDVHRHKGTVAAIRTAIHAAGYPDAEIIEGWAANLYDGAILYDGSELHASADEWAEYRVRLLQPVTVAKANALRRILARVAPLRCHLKVLDYQVASFVYDGEHAYDGSITHGVV